MTRRDGRAHPPSCRACGIWAGARGTTCASSGAGPAAMSDAFAPTRGSLRSSGWSSSSPTGRRTFRPSGKRFVRSRSCLLSSTIRSARASSRAWHIPVATFVEYSMFGKSLELLRRVALAAKRIAFLFSPDTSAYYERFLPAFETEARGQLVDVAPARVRNEADIDAATRELAAKPAGAMIVPPDTYTLANRGLIVEAAARHRVPAIHAYRQSVKEGGLMSYGPETADIFRRSASYVDRILKGANPAELPAQAPTKFEFAVNLKSAAALGLSVPPTLLALADEVIE